MSQQAARQFGRILSQRLKSMPNGGGFGGAGGPGGGSGGPGQGVFAGVGGLLILSAAGFAINASIFNGAHGA